MVLTRFSFPLNRFVNINLFHRCYLSTERSETISAALKRFYLKVHPDLFTLHPKEKVNKYNILNDLIIIIYLRMLMRRVCS
jgi:hypothetical protein